MRSKNCVAIGKIAVSSILVLQQLPACSPAPSASGLSAAPATSAAISLPATIQAPSPVQERTSIPKLEDRLAQILAAYRAGDRAQLERLADPSVNLNSNTARVILEMDISPDAHAVSGPTIEKITLPDGRTVEIEHAPAIAIRSDLAQAIAATGATYETAYANSVQILAPISSLEALTKVAGVRHIRLPLATPH